MVNFSNESTSTRERRAKQKEKRFYEFFFLFCRSGWVRPTLFFLKKYQIKSAAERRSTKNFFFQKNACGGTLTLANPTSCGNASGWKKNSPKKKSGGTERHKTNFFFNRWDCLQMVQVWGLAKPIVLRMVNYLVE